jgi:hypothetical protein
LLALKIGDLAFCIDQGFLEEIEMIARAAQLGFATLKR